MPVARSAAVVLLVAAASGAAFLATVGCEREEAGGAALVVSPDPIDFGEVRWGDTPSLKVTVRNRSDRTVTLKDPEMDCPCFTLARPPELSRLDPGRSLTLEVVLRSTLSKGGLTRKTFVLRSDDPVKPKLDVPIQATVLLVRTIEPQSLDFGLVDAGADVVEKVVRVRGGHGFHVRVARATFAPADRPLDVEVRAPPDGAEGSDLVIRTRKGGKGLLSGQVALDMEVTDEKGEKRAYREAVWVQGEAR